MLTRQEKLFIRSKEIFKDQYNAGLSISDIYEIADNLKKIGDAALANPENTINAISNGRLKI